MTDHAPRASRPSRDRRRSAATGRRNSLEYRRDRTENRRDRHGFPRAQCFVILVKICCDLWVTKLKSSSDPACWRIIKSGQWNNLKSTCVRGRRDALFCRRGSSSTGRWGCCGSPGGSSDPWPTGRSVGNNGATARRRRGGGRVNLIAYQVAGSVCAAGPTIGNRRRSRSSGLRHYDLRALQVWVPTTPSAARSWSI